MTLFLVLAGGFTCGFFLYVLVKFHGESQRLNVPKKHLRDTTEQVQTNLEREKPRKSVTERSSRMAFTSVETSRAGTLPNSNTEAVARRDAWVSVTVGVCGLAALFAGIEIFNLLKVASH